MTSLFCPLLFPSQKAFESLKIYKHQLMCRIDDVLRRQPERSEVSLYIICIMADRVSLYFIGDCPRSYLGESSKTAPQMRKVPF